ncbi:2Fe-2S iron-sulfur cluster-binding protein [Siccirubricoccus sp. KC 17139]|uniref:2Fe-2S iron-sulfur cluster-binding protein n=1 Tax=Siccirubricoccus soli TaxID=2899147 RepID=A0ABT1D309_9PROT|nr:2Fe-2S iron-sulfur cluster-binding protein [Siccirubricoccus soli]MCO6416319.1 2Fe-2S iron-sulfur cluster-binding protein [Siccirubricoccus soli]MCP2682453.1 2Fe-2S iron-sulfur cluster-binding protein [Siccirubricoccus soli]
MRLPSGGRIDRSKPLRFTFDGRAFTGFAGDTLASALLANGVHLLGRSFKYHRPRGLLSAGAEEPNALVEIDRGPGRREPNTRATMVPLVEGLTARSQNRFPSLRFDLAALASLAAPLLPAGFYYKTFLGPGREAWHRRWEPLIRRMAGLGRAPEAPDPDRYAHRFAHCETLVIGAGRAGIAAALEAAEAGDRVILCDEQMEPGGRLLLSPGEVPGLAALRGNLRVTLLPRTTAFHYGLQNFVSLAEILDRPDGLRERLWQVRTARVVLATGALERPLPFRGNDRPGVMLADAARAYAARWAVLPGRQAVLLAAHDSGYEAAFALQDRGARIAAILDLRAAPPLAAAARARGIEVRAAHGIAATRGGLRVTGVLAAPLRPDGSPDAARATPIPCDLVLMAGGWTPNLALFSQARGRLRWDEAADAFLPGEVAEALTCAGACAAGRGPGHPIAAIAAGALTARRAFVDPQNDVTTRDIALAVQEGFRSIEHVKRYTTTGMATDQGKVGGMLGLATAAAASGRTVPETGHTTFRPPYTPLSFGTLAGRHRGPLFDPIRTAPSHGWAEAHGAVFEPVGQWQRARAYPRAGEALHAAVARECLAVRQKAGLLDASTLGKIEIVGPDAAEFLERCYVNAVHSLRPGRCRYALLLREDGFLFDDGVLARLAEDRFHLTTTTGGAARVLHLLEDYAQTEFPALRVFLTSTTEHWGVAALQGPAAREMLAPLVRGCELAALPHMTVAEAEVMGIPARLFRVSFTGELGYEINLPADRLPELWEALIAAGATPYGTDAMHVLRAEKGYVIVGQETDGTVTPLDLGLGWVIGKAKRDFIGKRSLARAEMQRPDRRQLVGLAPLEGRAPEEGAQLLARPGAREAEGHVTSAYASAALGRPIALGLLARGRARHGETVLATRLDGPPQPLQIVPPVFWDPEGKRLHG